MPAPWLYPHRHETGLRGRLARAWYRHRVRVVHRALLSGAERDRRKR